jgi:hypothetical protein
MSPTLIFPVNKIHKIFAMKKIILLLAAYIYVQSPFVNATDVDGKPQVIHVFIRASNNDNPREVTAALVNMDSISGAGDGCDQVIGSVKVEGVQFSASGITLESFRFTDKQGSQWSVPTNIGMLSNASRQDANSFIRVGHTYFAHIQNCGSGGFSSLISIYDVSLGFGMLDKPSLKNAEPKKTSYLVKVETVFPSTTYLDSSSIVRIGETAKAWFVQDFDDDTARSWAKSNKQALFLSDSFQNEFDCKKNMLRGLHYTTFSDHMGKGHIVYDNPKTLQWITVPANLVPARQMVCN